MSIIICSSGLVSQSDTSIKLGLYCGFPCVFVRIRMWQAIQATLLFLFPFCNCPHCSRKRIPMEWNCSLLSTTVYKSRSLVSRLFVFQNTHQTGFSWCIVYCFSLDYLFFRYPEGVSKKYVSPLCSSVESHFATESSLVLNNNVYLLLSWSFPTFYTPKEWWWNITYHMKLLCFNHRCCEYLEFFVQNLRK